MEQQGPWSVIVAEFHAEPFPPLPGSMKVSKVKRWLADTTHPKSLCFSEDLLYVNH